MAKWKKGQSGNPLGRPKNALNLAAREMKQTVCENVDLVKIVKRMEQKALRGSEVAARILFEFGWGKPRQEAELSLRYATVNLVSAVRTEIAEEDKKLMGSSENR
jgi:hypothetical protein